MSAIARVRHVHRIAVVLIARRLGLGLERSRHNHRPAGVRRAASLRNHRPALVLSAPHHDPARRRVLVRWQAWIGRLFS